jgi:hypothetical protein
MAATSSTWCAPVFPASPGVYVGSLDGRVKKQLIQSNWAAMYAEGHLLYMEKNILMARRPRDHFAASMP